MTDRRSVLAALAILATAFGAWLRVHGLADQIVQDDEWHALHKLMGASYGEIFRSFGLADHSIPLTMLYKAMATAFGLDEVNLRALQVTCGIALVPLAGWLAWKATRDEAIAALLALLVAGAPFLVLYSRIARPYAITTLAIAVVLAALWRWREQRTLALAVSIAALTSLSAWLHPISAAFPAVALLFFFVEDLAYAAPDRARRAASTVALAAGCALAIMAPLATPLASDLASLSDKARGDFAGLYTLWRAASLFAGGLPDPVTVGVLVVAAWGAWRLAAVHRALGRYLLAIVVVPVTLFAMLGAQWSHQGHTFARYVFPVQLVLLFWFCVGAMDLVRRITPTGVAAPNLASALALAAAYLMLNPVIRQVDTLGPWYSHLYHQFDYVARHNAAARQYEGYEAPAFYRRLGAMPAGTAPVIEAPFTFAAPANSFAYFATFHRQPERMGMLHDLCFDGPRLGEVPRDPRFRFRTLVFLDDPVAVRASGARYLLLFLEQHHAKPFAQAGRCLARLSELYGEPLLVEPRLVVFELGAEPPAATLRRQDFPQPRWPP